MFLLVRVTASPFQFVSVLSTDVFRLPAALCVVMRFLRSTKKDPALAGEDEDPHRNSSEQEGLVFYGDRNDLN